MTINKGTIDNMFDMTGMNAIVTGGGKGLGKGIAEGFLKQGANVVITGSSDAIFEAEKGFEDIGYAGRIKAIHMDMLDRKQRAEAFDKCVRHFDGKLDVLVNNAGIQRRIPVLEFPPDEWDAILEVNLTSVFDMCQRAAQIMKERHYGKIINISSIGAHISSARNIPAYQAAKGGVRQLTVCLADELAKYNICTNAIAPGYAKTELTRAVYEDPEACEMTCSKIPLGRWATPTDLAGAAVMLASHAGDFINGASIVIDGGTICR